MPHLLRWGALTNNSNEGISLEVSSISYQNNDNSIHHNAFIDNGKRPQATDYIGNNSWDYGFEGNWWSDYNGTDQNGDGIGDTPYLIGRAQHQIYQREDVYDRYPLMVISNPNIAAPNSVIVEITAVPTYPLEGNIVMIIVDITIDVGVNGTGITFLVDDQLVDQFRMDLPNGTTTIVFNWTALQGSHKIMVVFARPINTNASITINSIERISGHSSSGLTTISPFSIVLLCLIITTVQKRNSTEKIG